MPRPKIILPTLPLADYLAQRDQWATVTEAAVLTGIGERSLRMRRAELGAVHVESLTPGQVILAFPRSALAGLTYRRMGRKPLVSRGK